MWFSVVVNSLQLTKPFKEIWKFSGNSELPRPSTHLKPPMPEFETEANLVTVTFFLRIFTGLRIGCFVRRQRLGGMWFSFVCVVFGLVSGFPFFVVSGKEKFVARFCYPHFFP